MAFTSSSGQTFSKAWRALKEETQSSFLGLVVDRPCPALEVAQTFLPPEKIFNFSSPNKETFERKYSSWVEENSSKFSKAPLIFLIGYFRLISADLLNGPSPLINTHPSLLPAFPGLDMKVHEAAFEHALISGFSVHLVNEEMDAGPIVFQKAVDTSHCKSTEKLREEVRKIEQRYLPQVIDQLVLTDINAQSRHLTTRQLQTKKGFPITCVD